LLQKLFGQEQQLSSREASIIDELEKLAPGASYRDFAAQGGNVVSIALA